MSMLTVLMLNSWNQQDGAIAHTARESVECARAMFSGRFIPRLSDIAGRPGLRTSLRLFSLGTLESGSVHERTSHT
jgi:hypothetical protein